MWGFSLGVKGDKLAPSTLHTIWALQRELAWAKQNDRPFSAVILTGGVFAPNQTIPVSKLMAKELGRKGIPVYIGVDSTITRHDVTDGVAVLARNGFELSQCDITVVSEYWHTLGIWLLFFRRFGIRVRRIPSGLRISLQEIAERILRLGLYWRDPKGEGGRSTTEANRRAKNESSESPLPPAA